MAGWGIVGAEIHPFLKMPRLRNTGIKDHKNPSLENCHSERANNSFIGCFILSPIFFNELVFQKGGKLNYYHFLRFKETLKNMFTYAEFAVFEKFISMDL